MKKEYPIGPIKKLKRFITKPIIDESFFIFYIGHIYTLDHKILAILEVQNSLQEVEMARGDKSKYTDKQKRTAHKIERGYEDRGVSKGEAERRAWATVNKNTGGGKKGGSGSKSSSSRGSSSKSSSSKSSSSKKSSGSKTSRSKSTGAKKKSSS
jgi:hypothetical protein